jgi:hypothetical protein
VILPREISDGNYHFVDGDAVCRDCFTRLSRRLRPVTGQRAESDTQPVPVDLTDLEKELSKGTSGLGPPSALVPRQIPSSARLTPVRRYRPAQTVFMVVCFVLGVTLGGWGYYVWYESKRAAQAEPPANDHKNQPPAPPPRTDPEQTAPTDDGGALPAAPANAVVVPVEADAYVRGGRFTKEKRGDRVEILLVHGSPDEECEGYLRFDLSALKNEVAEARLGFYVLVADKLGAESVEVDAPADSSWDEKALCWENRPRPGRIYAKVSPARGAAEIDVTAAVRDALEKGRKLTLHLTIRQIGPGAVLRFASKENARQDRRPRLVIVPGPGPLPEPKAPEQEPGPQTPPPVEPVIPGVRKDQGLLGEYYADQKLEKLVLKRVDPTVNFTWGTGVPAADVPENDFSVRWTGFVVPPQSGRYTFSASTDDGVRLWIDGKLLIEKWVSRKETDDSAAVDLVAGQKHAIRMEYFDKTGDAVAKLRWSGPGINDTQPIAKEYLLPPENKGEDKPPAGDKAGG